MNDRLRAATCGCEGGFVYHVRKFRTAVAGRAACGDGEVHILGHLHLLRVDFQNFLTALHVGQCDSHLTVETTGAKERRVEHVRAVRCRDDDHTVLRVEAVHLHEQRIQRLFTLIVTTAHAVSAMATDSVNFINENQAGRALLSLLKHIAHAARADAHKHLHEIRTTDREKRHIRFTSDRSCEQRLACAGRADHQDTLRNVTAEFLKTFRVFEELNNLLHFLLRLLHTGHVLERHFVLIARQHARLALSEIHRALASHAQLLAEEEIQQQQDESDGQEIEQHPHDCIAVVRFDRHLDPGIVQVFFERAVVFEIHHHPHWARRLRRCTGNIQHLCADIIHRAAVIYHHDRRVLHYAPFFGELDEVRERHLLRVPHRIFKVERASDESHCGCEKKQSPPVEVRFLRATAIGFAFAVRSLILLSHVLFAGAGQ